MQPQQKEMQGRAAKLMGNFGELIQQTESPSQAFHWENRQNSPARSQPGTNLRYLI